MPITAVYVQHVRRTRFLEPGTFKTRGTRFEILARTPPGSDWREIVFFTWDALKASLCERARLAGRLVTIADRDTKWGQEIVTVNLQQEAEAS